jgi:hypothetical protein
MGRAPVSTSVIIAMCKNPRERCRAAYALQARGFADQAARVPVMMSADEAAMIDEWRRKHPDLPSRSEAIRQLVQLGLKAKK